MMHRKGLYVFEAVISYHSYVLQRRLIKGNSEARGFNSEALDPVYRGWHRKSSPDLEIQGASPISMIDPT